MPFRFTEQRMHVVRTLIAATEYARIRDLAEASGVTYAVAYTVLRHLHELHLTDLTRRPTKAPSRTSYHVYRLNDRGRRWAERTLMEKEDPA